MHACLHIISNFIVFLCFQGIAPKLEFSTKATIMETSTPGLDVYDDLNTVNTVSVSIINTTIF